MKLILFRHGLAVEREISLAGPKDDSLRPLVEKGRERSRKMAKALSELIGDVDLIVTSPLLRAVQTTEIVCGLIKAQKVVEISELVPEAPPQAFARWLQASAARATSVIAIGHEPQLSAFASWVLAGRNESFIELKKSGFISLEIESFDSIGPNVAELKAVVAPKMLG